MLVTDCLCSAAYNFNFLRNSLPVFQALVLLVGGAVFLLLLGFFVCVCTQLTQNDKAASDPAWHVALPEGSQTLGELPRVLLMCLESTLSKGGEPRGCGDWQEMKISAVMRNAL